MSTIVEWTAANPALIELPSLSDTNALRQILIGNNLVAERFSQIPDDEVFVSVIAVRETIRGVMDVIGQREKQGAKGLALAYDALHRLIGALQNFQIHPYTEEADALYRSWTGRGSGPGQNDWRIAASAVSAGMTVITADKGFRKIQDFVPELAYEDFGLADPEIS